LLDEDQFALAGCRRRISIAHLKRFVTVLEQITAPSSPAAARTWLYVTRLLQAASTTELRGDGWQLPSPSQKWTLAVQEAGWQKFGSQFRFLGYELRAFAFSAWESRERLANGDLAFAAPPVLNGPCMIFSGTAHPELLRHRLGRDFAAPFAEHQFQHPGTRWYNLASRIGMRKHFPGNAAQILDFFAGLVAQRLRQGRRPLLVAKKCFAARCAAGLNERLAAFGVANAQVITEGWTPERLVEPGVVPLISYGMVGTNLFEEFDAVYCVTGFYTTDAILNGILQDPLASDLHLPLRITTKGWPRRRQVVTRHIDRYYDISRLAPLALEQVEMGVVLQAVGRVRPYTRPREVLTFQCGSLPKLSLDAEFATLAEARRFFGIPGRREQQQNANRERVQAARRQGKSQSDAVAALGLGIATVKRYWKLDELEAPTENLKP